MHDVGPVLKMMALIYPAMQTMVKFYHYKDIIKIKDSFLRALSYKFEDGRYMPVTRELSDDSIRMIQNWIRNPVYNKSKLMTNQFKEVTDII